MRRIVVSSLLFQIRSVISLGLISVNHGKDDQGNEASEEQEPKAHVIVLRVVLEDSTDDEWTNKSRSLAIVSTCQCRIWRRELTLPRVLYRAKKIYIFGAGETSAIIVWPYENQPEVRKPIMAW